VRVKALRSVRHDIVLPYLDWIACQWADAETCKAIRRIGTDRALELLDTLAARDDRVGEAARKSMTMPLEVTMWDVR